MTLLTLVVCGGQLLDLSRLAADGHLERIAHGVYKDAGAPVGPHDDLQAAWLSTDPKAMGEARIKDLANGVVVAGESAADLHGIGDFRALRHEFVSPTRRQSQRSGREAIQAFVGALAGNQANQGVFITTSRFARTAIDYADSVATRVILIDGDRLARLMIRYGVGVQVKRTIHIVEVDEDFFE